MTTNEYGQRVCRDGEVLGVIVWPGFDPEVDTWWSNTTDHLQMVTRPAGGDYDDWVDFTPPTLN